jgi:hypothetical protein
MKFLIHQCFLYTGLLLLFSGCGGCNRQSKDPRQAQIENQLVVTPLQSYRLDELVFNNANKKDFRKLILAFFIAPFLAMPFWYVLPAVSPDDMYRKNLYSLKSILPIQKQFEETSKGEKLSAFLNFLEQPERKNANQDVVNRLLFYNYCIYHNYLIQPYFHKKHIG